MKKFENDRYYDGISICPEWKDDYHEFHRWAMANGYKKNLTIDRRDNSGDYKPSNCRWVTQSVQVQNQGLSTKNTSGVKGVCWDKSRQKWKMAIQHEGKTYSKRFNTKEEAINARKEKIKELGSEHRL